MKVLLSRDIFCEYVKSQVSEMNVCCLIKVEMIVFYMIFVCRRLFYALSLCIVKITFVIDRKCSACLPLHAELKAHQMQISHILCYIMFYLLSFKLVLYFSLVQFRMLYHIKKKT